MGDGVGVGVGSGPWARTKLTGTVASACVPDTSSYKSLPEKLPAGRPLTVSDQTPLVSRTSLCEGNGVGFDTASKTNFTLPVTTGKEVGRVTFTLKVTALSVVVALWDVNNIVDGSCFGIKSSSAGVQIPLISSRKDF